MRELADRRRIERLMGALGERADPGTRVHLVGGATAVLVGWRESTIDVDLVPVSGAQALLRAVPELKETLRVNIELASPLDFIPVLEGWQERGRYIATEGNASFYHFDLTAQALAKAERGHAHDLEDIRQMLTAKLVEPETARRTFDLIEPELYRFPAVDPPSFRRAVEELFGS